MLSDASHGFSLREQVIKAGKENTQKYEKYFNVKIIKNFSFSFFIASFPKFHLPGRPYINNHLFPPSKILPPFLQKRKGLTFLAATPSSTTSWIPCLPLRPPLSSQSPLTFWLKSKCSLVSLYSRELLLYNSPKLRWKNLRTIISLTKITV